MTATLASLDPAVVFVLGLLMVLLGGDRFTDAAVRISLRLGVPQVVVGATLVSLATTLPELATSLTAVLSDAPDLAVGNAVGSVITNLGLILAVGAILRPVALAGPMSRATAAALALAVLITWWLMLDGTLARSEGLILLLAGAVFFGLRVRIALTRRRETVAGGGGAGAGSAAQGGQGEGHAAGREPASLPAEAERDARGPVVWFVLGAALVIGGSQLLVDGGTSLARVLGVPELVIGLSLVALGTSLPELVVAIASALKGHPQLAAGNLLGASLLNLVLVLAAVALATPLATGVEVRAMTIPVMAGMAVLLAAVVWWRGRLDRGPGVLLFVIYAGYLVWLLGAGNAPV